MEAVTDWEALWKRGGFNRWPSEELVRWASTLEEGSKVLEVGCGAGPNLRALQSFGHQVWGVDISTEAFVAAESLPGAYGTVVITPVSATDLPFEDEKFDAVCDVQCFQHLAQDELPLAYKEAARVLKPGGRFFEVFLTAGQENFPDLPFCKWSVESVARHFDCVWQDQSKHWRHNRFYEYCQFEGTAR